MIAFRSTRRARAGYAAGVRALDAGDCDLALCWFRDARRAAPRSAAVLLGLGLAHLRKGEFDPAVAVLSEAIRLGGDPRGYFLRGLCYEGKGDLARAESDRREAVRRDPLVERSLLRPA